MQTMDGASRVDFTASIISSSDCSRKAFITRGRLMVIQATWSFTSNRMSLNFFLPAAMELFSVQWSIVLADGTDHARHAHPVLLGELGELGGVPVVLDDVLLAHAAGECGRPHGFL